MTTHQSAKFGHIDLQTLMGVQTALQNLGFDPGTCDGVDGPNTQTAVRAFQASRGLESDGVVGRDTRAALATALDEVAANDVPDNTGMAG
jgi:peptidoglycan hydrolase-like protein with peptidoglycan-binding domain